MQTVTEFYQTEMVNNSWAESQAAVITDSAVVLNYQKDGRDANINLAATGGLTAVGLTYTP